MKLQLKKEYLDWSINSGGRNVKRKLKNIHPTEFENLYNLGYTDFFDVIDDNILENDLSSLDEVKTGKKTKKTNDINIGE
jgi:hypothetical protein